MPYKPPGISKKTSKPYSASYRCGFQGCTSVEWIKDAAPAPAAQPRVRFSATGVSGPEVRSAAPAQSRDRMIYAQTAVKAACELCTDEADMKRLAMEFFAAFSRVEAGQPLTFPHPAPQNVGPNRPESNPAQAQASATIPGHFPPDPDEDINF